MNDAAASRAVSPPASAVAPFAGSLATQLPVLVMLALLLVVWYAAAIYLNAPRCVAELERHGGAWTTLQLVEATWTMTRPVMPAPHQVIEAFASGLFTANVLSPRSLVFHTFVTLQSATVGLALAVAVGVALAILIVHVRFLELALLPWIVASQATPVLATAPMIVVALGHFGFTGLAPKALIAASTAFFPIVIGMTIGLRAADPLQLDLMQTYNASRLQLLLKLRWSAAIPYLLPSLKVAVTLAIVGAIVGELPTGAQAGLGARILVLSYTGLMLMMWGVLVAAAALSAGCIGAVDLVERLIRARRGGRL